MKRYDEVLKLYEEANLKTNMSLSLLNFGQQFIFSAGLTGIMLFAANGIKQGTFICFGSKMPAVLFDRYELFLCCLVC